MINRQSEGVFNKSDEMKGRRLVKLRARGEKPIFAALER